MSEFKMIHGSCADQNADIVVNAANRDLRHGSGICGVIFDKAGAPKLEAACRGIKTPLNDGDAVLTPAFDMANAKAIIHAVGPNFGITPDAFDKLFNAYYKSLLVMKENGYHSISFPLISSSIFGGNLKDAPGESAKQCALAYRKFTGENPDYDITVMLCGYGLAEFVSASKAVRLFLPDGAENE